MMSTIDTVKYPYGYFADPESEEPIDGFKYLDVRHGPGRSRWWFVTEHDLTLREDLLFIDPHGNEWFVEAGFPFNGGSIPWWGRPVCSPTQPEALAAFCLHDFLCTSPYPCDSITAAYVFWCAMRVNGYYRLGAFRNWFAVYNFGPVFSGSLSPISIRSIAVKVQEIVTNASKKVGWVEFLIPLIPVLAELLQDILEDCANTEDEAVNLLSDPAPWMVRYMNTRVRMKLRQEPGYLALSMRDRRKAAMAVVRDTITVAGEDPELVCEAYREAVAA